MKYDDPRLEHRRKTCIVALKATVRKLGMDDDTYRAMLLQHTGKRSAADLSLAQLGTVLDQLRAKGGTNPRHGRRRPVPAAERAPLLAKVDALLGELGAVTGSPKGLKYADAIARRNGWADNVDFCDAAALHKLVAALNTTLRSAVAKRVV